MNRTKKTAYTGPAAHEYDRQRFIHQQGRAFHQLELTQLEKAVGRLAGTGHILEIGCGTGRFLEALRGRGFSLVGMDPSADMLAISKKKLETDAELVQGEGADLPFSDRSFHLVFSIRVLNQTESEAYAYRVIDEMVRVTRPGGYLLIEFANRLRPVSPKNRAIRLSFYSLERWVEAQSNLRLLDETGILVLSQTLLERIPGWCLPPWIALDRTLSARFPRIAARGYLLLERID